jgi:1-aminocyclopropane-1-carboxylate deaminase/D-cysteine desulfhydrase-like pyridoxal-dependent ACC family enzyme
MLMSIEELRRAFETAYQARKRFDELIVEHGGRERDSDEYGFLEAAKEVARQYELPDWAIPMLVEYGEETWN